MNDIIKNVIIPILASIIGGIVGVVFQRLVYPNSDDNKINLTLLNNYNNIHFRQSKRIEEKVIYKEKAQVSNNESPETDIFAQIVIIFITGLVLIWFYLKYEVIISYVIMISALFINLLSLSATIFVTKLNINIDKNFKFLLGWMIFLTISIPIQLYILKHPFFGYVDKVKVFQIINSKGLLSLFSYFGLDTFWFLLYQIFGVIFLVIFILYLILGNLYIWAMINLAVNSKIKKLWKFLYGLTSRFIPSESRFIGISFLLLFSSFLLSSGIIAHFVIK